MAFFPVYCDLHGNFLDVYQMDGNKKLIHGIFNVINKKICEKCGNPSIVEIRGEIYCGERYLHDQMGDVDGSYQIGYYYKRTARNFEAENDKLSSDILHLKKHWKKHYAIPLGIAMYTIIENQFSHLFEADVIIPVPNHPDDPNAEAKAVALSAELHNQFKIHDHDIELIDGLQKLQNISTQGLTRDEKEELAENMFKFNNTVSVKGKKIILVDDVITNGIFKGKCASLLKENGAEKVWSFVAGRNFSIPI